MTTIDYSQPIILPMQNGGVHKLQLDPKIHGHRALMAAIESACENASETFHPETIRKFDSLSERALIAKNALTKCGIVAGL